VGIAFDIADNAIIGRYNLESYMAVTVIGAMLYYFMGSVGTLSLSLSLNGAKLLKEKRYKAYQQLFNTTLLIGLILSMLLMLATFVFSDFLLQYLFSGKPLVLDIATGYLHLVVFRFPLHVLIFTFSAYFKTAEKSKVLIYASTLSAGLNIVVNYVLVFGVMGAPKMGAEGVAIGTLSGLLLSLCVYLLAFFKQQNIKLSVYFGAHQAKIILSSFVVLFVQDLFEFSVFYFLLLGVIAQSGVADAAVYSIMSTLFLVLMMIAYAYGNALIILVRKESDKPRYTLTLLTSSSLIFAGVYVLYTGLLFALGESGPALLTNESSLFPQTVNILLLFSISQLFIGITTLLRYYLNALSLDKFVLKVCCSVCTSAGLGIYVINQYHGLSFPYILGLFAATYVLLTLIFSVKVYQYQHQFTHEMVIT